MSDEISQPPAGERDAAAAALAAHQHGNITAGQLSALGFNPAAVQHRIVSARIFRVHHGVYAWGRPLHLPLERAAAAVLACGPAALLSHGGALMLWDFGLRWPDRFDVTLPAGDRRPRNITTHRARGLTRADITVQHGIPCTSPARTVLDCLPATPASARVRLVQNALLTPYLTRGALADAAARFDHHPGTRIVAPMLGLSETRSPIEDEFLAFCAGYGLPTPRTNVLVAGHLVDALFAEHRLIVELDGWDTHRERWSFESDRDRDADTLAIGISTVRVTRERLRGSPQREAARLWRILDQRANGRGRAGG
jgi:hypothetical protein